LVDLKTGIRFIRHNAAAIPGDMDKIISVGWSAGGAMSTLLGVTGDSKNYEKLLEANGAFMEESDAVYASQIYCPIIDLEHADLAYEWMFAADKENENSPAGPAEVMTPFKEALSKILFKDYIAYFNSLSLKNPQNGQPLVLDEDGRSGSGYDYLMEKLSESASVYLRKLEAGELPEKYSVSDYLNGNYTYMGPAPVPAAPGPGKDMPPMEPPTLGDLVSRPPKGMEKKPFVPPMAEFKGKDKNNCLSWDGKAAIVSDLDSYVLNHRRRMKPCTSFDVLAKNSGENKVFGTAEKPAVHFNIQVAEAIEALKDQFPEEYAIYHDSYNEALWNPALAERKYLINPLNYIGTEEKAKQAEHYRIRVGASDADTSLSVSMTLACKLAQAGKDVDYALVWDQPHSEADYPGEVVAWIEGITK
jgi:hypothetical protein